MSAPGFQERETWGRQHSWSGTLERPSPVQCCPLLAGACHLMRGGDELATHDSCVLPDTGKGRERKVLRSVDCSINALGGANPSADRHSRFDRAPLRVSALLAVHTLIVAVIGVSGMVSFT